MQILRTGTRDSYSCAVPARANVTCVLRPGTTITTRAERIHAAQARGGHALEREARMLSAAGASRAIPEAAALSRVCVAGLARASAVRVTVC